MPKITGIPSESNPLKFFYHYVPADPHNVSFKCCIE